MVHKGFTVSVQLCMLQSRVIIVLCVYHIDAMISELFIYIYSTVFKKEYRYTCTTGCGVCDTLCTHLCNIRGSTCMYKVQVQQYRNSSTGTEGKVCAYRISTHITAVPVEHCGRPYQFTFTQRNTGTCKKMKKSQKNQVCQQIALKSLKSR